MATDSLRWLQRFGRRAVLSQKGFTLVEMAMTSVMSGMVLISIYIIVSGSHDYIIKDRKQLNLQQDFTLINDILTRKINEGNASTHEIYADFEAYDNGDPTQSSGSCLKLYFPSGDSTILFVEKSHFKIQKPDLSIDSLVQNVVSSLAFTEGTNQVSTAITLNQNGKSMTASLVHSFRNDQVTFTSTPLSLNVLFVVINSSSLTTEEANTKTLIESWGWTVNPISATSSQSTFDTQVSNNNVVYISEEVNSSDLNTKLRNAAIGVVNEEVNLADDFGLSSTWGFPSSTTTISITDDSHFITSPFGTGSLTLFTSNQEVTNISNNSSERAPGLEILGEFSASEPSLAAIDTDSLLNMRVLLMVGDTDLSSEASARKTLLESWGYTVTTIDDGDDQDDFDDAADDHDVVYVLEEVSSSTVSKVADFTIGVVSAEDNGDDALAFASSDGSDFTGTAIDITDNTHYITSSFSTGSLTILTSSDDMAYLNGTLASGRQTLAERVSSSSEVLSILETGATLYGGGSAPGRRVRLPWHAIQLSRLNSSGRTILKRSLQWAAKCTAAGRRVELPWGANNFDITSLTDDGKTLMKRSLEWAAAGGS